MRLWQHIIQWHRFLNCLFYTFIYNVYILFHPINNVAYQQPLHRVHQWRFHSYHRQLCAPFITQEDAVRAPDDLPNLAPRMLEILQEETALKLCTFLVPECASIPTSSTRLDFPSYSHRSKGSHQPFCWRQSLQMRFMDHSFGKKLGCHIKAAANTLLG